MQKMLNKSKSARYSKFEQISTHVWFKDFDWDELISLNMESPYKFQIESKLNNNDSMAYLEYVKTLKDWEIPEGNPEISNSNIKEFENWLQHF